MMKYKFSRTCVYIPEWNNNRAEPEGSQLVATIQPLQMGDLIKMMDAFGGMEQARKVAEQAGASDGTAMMKVLQDFSDVLPKYITLDGLEDDDGPVGMADLSKYGTYIPLATELMMQAIAVSMPTAVTEGNSAAPPG